MNCTRNKYKKNCIYIHRRNCIDILNIYFFICTKNDMRCATLYNRSLKKYQSSGNAILYCQYLRNYTHTNTHRFFTLFLFLHKKPDKLKYSILASTNIKRIENKSEILTLSTSISAFSLSVLPTVK